MQFDLRKFMKLCHRVYEHTDIDYAAFLICNYVVDELKAKGVAAYLYNRLLDSQEIVSFDGHADFPDDLNGVSKEIAVISAFRKGLQCGAIAIDGLDDTKDRHLLDVAKLLVVLFNRKFSVDLFEHASKPINYLQDENSFHEDLKNLARESSQMPAGALRTLREKKLTTVFFWNDWNLSSFSPQEWDVDPEDESTLPHFAKCLASGKVVSLEDRDLNHSFLQRPQQSGVKAAVFCPINVGNDTIGVISLAMRRQYEFSEVEKKGFLSLANSIGVSLTNFSRAAVAELDLHNDVRISQILTAVEIAQAARHSARADLDTLKTLILTANRLLERNLDREEKFKIKETLQKCDSSITSCFKSLDDIKSAIRPPARQLEKVMVRDLFDSAKSQFRGRIIRNKVQVEWVGKDAEIECYPDHLKQVFLNLLLNSLDAFADLRRQNNRKIRARLHDFQENASNVVVRVEDDAGGIKVPELQMSANDHEMPVEELVFAKDVTSKGPDGSGWGLYISRKVVSDHGGHMSLIEYRNKTVFEITLKKAMSE